MAKERIELGPTGRTVAANQHERRYSSIGPTGRRVASNMAAFRADKGMTTEGLAARLTNHGVPIKASAITKIEKAQRRLTVDEFMAIAAALEVSPNALMLPVEVDRERPVEITGHREPVTARRAWRWMQGHAPLPGQHVDHQQFRENAKPWWLLNND